MFNATSKTLAAIALAGMMLTSCGDKDKELSLIHISEPTRPY